MYKYTLFILTLVAGMLVVSLPAMADCVPLPEAQSVPALGQWGMIAVAVALGAAGIYRITKHDK